MTNPEKTVVAVLSDLMFRVKIQEAAKRAGLESMFVESSADALTAAKAGPAVIIFDLNYPGAAPLETIAALKADETTRGIQLIGFVPHVQVDLRQMAEDKGCDLVVARSAFSQNLPALLERYVEK
ncbi:MAG TPA: response regulator [Bryobacteraceae bacterium]|nr:response regulator [Bryobacteraceae bacterium]